MRHPVGRRRRVAAAGPARRPRVLQRAAAAAAFVRSVRARASAASSAVRPSEPSPSSSTQRRPRRPVAARPGRGVMAARSAAAAGRSAAGRRWHHEQKCVARTPMTIRRIGRPQRAAGLAGPLVDVEALLHLAVAVGRRVVVDGAAPPLDRLAQDLQHVAGRGARSSWGRRDAADRSGWSLERQRASSA